MPVAVRPRRQVSAARLPHHILCHVFKHLSVKELSACLRVCQQWNVVIETYVIFTMLFRL